MDGDKNLREEVKRSGAVATPSIPEHSIYVMLPFQVPVTQTDALSDSLTSLTLHALSDSSFPLVHPGRLASGNPPLFAQGQFRLGDDLQDSVAFAFGVLARQGDLTRSMPCWSLTQAGRNVMAGDALRPPGDPRGLPGYRAGNGLVLPLGTQAKHRLAEVGDPELSELTARVLGLDVIVLPSGIGFALLRLGVAGNPGLGPVQELLHAIGHGNRASLRWACRDETQPEFNLSTLVSTLLAPAGILLRPRNRLFTYVVLRCTSMWTEAEAAAFRLSRHYTSDYLLGTPDGMAEGTVFLRPFTSVLHAASLEGFATLLSEESAHVTHGGAGTITQRYLVLAILAYHEHVLLLDLAQQAAGPRNGPVLNAEAEAAADRSRLAELVTHFLALRRRFRVPLASEVTMHNEVYGALRQVLRNDELERRIAQDIAQVSERMDVLAQEVETRRLISIQRLRAAEKRAAKSIVERKERHRAPLEGILAFTLTFLTSVAAAKEVRAIIGEYVELKGLHWVDILIFGICLALALIAGWYAASRHLEKHAEELDEDDVESRREHQRDESVHIGLEGQEHLVDG